MSVRSAKAAWGRRALIALPLFWLGAFFLLPFVELLRISFSEAAIAMPPYTPIGRFEEGRLDLSLNLGNYSYLLNDPLYAKAYLSSVWIAGLSTALALLVGYPMAWAIARAREPRRTILLLLVILPFWTSFLLRVYAWISLLGWEGPINDLLLWTGLLEQPIQLLQTDFAVLLGIVYTYLPFMVLPLYATLSRMDETLGEAAADLGAGPAVTFLTVILPLSLPGVLAGSLLVFVPAVGEFIIPTLLGGPDTLMIGRVLWTEFFNNRDWPVASAVAIVMLVIVVAPILWLRSLQARAPA